MKPSGPSLLTRFAPTPSGYLHAGNAWSFLLTWLLARSQGGKIHLRVDDIDAARFRESYLEDIFASLVWLGLDWDAGPKNPEEFHVSYSQRRRRDHYRAALDIVMAQKNSEGPRVYACACSREDVKRASQAAGRPGIYPGTCRDLGLPVVPAKLWQSGKGLTSPDREPVLRLRVPENTEIALADEVAGSVNLCPGRDIGDFVIWQRNGEPSYQLTSVVDDESLGVNMVVRGRDLLPSTGAQIYLAQCLGARAFIQARFLHHGLVLGANHEKLSKSSGVALPDEASTLQTLRKQSHGRAELYALFANRFGIDKVRSPMNPQDFLQELVSEGISGHPVLKNDFPFSNLT